MISPYHNMTKLEKNQKSEKALSQGSYIKQIN